MTIIKIFFLIIKLLYRIVGYLSIKTIIIKFNLSGASTIFL